MNDETARISRVDVDVLIDAPVDVVWTELTTGIGRWWPEDFYAGGETGQRSFALELHPGGRMYETWSSGGGVLWGTVIGLEPKRRLQVAGVTFPDWGGPSQWMGTWSLSVRDDQTALRFSDASIGKASEKGVVERAAGWQYLCEALKAHVEGRPEPDWPG